jgi:molybdopterin synthase catalytic subunit
LITERAIRQEDYAIHDPAHECGAVATFTGVVRANNEGRSVTAIHYDCYREMAEREMRAIVKEVLADSRATQARAVHRIGELVPGDISMLVVVASPHRSDAFDACHRIVDAIKLRVPIWKKEHYVDQTARWL